MLKQAAWRSKDPTPETLHSLRRTLLPVARPARWVHAKNTHSTMQNLQIVKNNTSNFDIPQAILPKFK